MNATSWTTEILYFWFEELDPKDWWNKNEQVDGHCKDRFLELWTEQKSKTSDAFASSPQLALAAVILFDQLPRNMFRDTAEAFATDHLAVQITKKAVELGLDQQLTEDQRAFLYMPLMHSEDLDDQNQSVTLFTALGSNQKFANNHRDVIARFGRFPHRNELLGRAMRPGEREAINAGAKW